MSYHYYIIAKISFYLITWCQKFSFIQQKNIEAKVEVYSFCFRILPKYVKSEWKKIAQQHRPRSFQIHNNCSISNTSKFAIFFDTKSRYCLSFHDSIYYITNLFFPWWISMDHFVKHKPLISREWFHNQSKPMK